MPTSAHSITLPHPFSYVGTALYGCQCRRNQRGGPCSGHLPRPTPVRWASRCSGPTRRAGRLASTLSIVAIGTAEASVVLLDKPDMQILQKLDLGCGHSVSVSGTHFLSGCELIVVDARGNLTSLVPLSLDCSLHVVSEWPNEPARSVDEIGPPEFKTPRRAQRKPRLVPEPRIAIMEKLRLINRQGWRTDMKFSAIIAGHYQWGGQSAL